MTVDERLTALEVKTNGLYKLHQGAILAIGVVLVVYLVKKYK
jgi:hypothetical protein